MSKKRRHHEQDATGEDARVGVAADAADGTSEDVAGSAAGDAPEVDELTGLRREVEEWKDKFLRAKAEQQNAIRRAQNEREDAVRFANVALLRALLDVVDDFDRTLDAAAEAGNTDALLQGLKLVREKLDKFLKDHAVETIEALGEPFDPLRHEALLQQPSTERAPGTVMQQVQRGYMVRDRVLRPAKVIVAAAPEASAEDANKSERAEE